MNIGYLGIRGAVIVTLVWTMIISILGYLRGPYLTWSEIVTETEISLTAECGFIALIGVIGFVIILCLHDWD